MHLNKMDKKQLLPSSSSFIHSHDNVKIATVSNSLKFKEKTNVQSQLSWIQKSKTIPFWLKIIYKNVDK